MSDKRNEQRDSSTIETQTIRGDRGELAVHLLDRSEQMDGEKKALLQMILGQGGTYDQVARLSGEHASAVSRRFRAMVRRLSRRPLDTTGNTQRNLTPLEKTILIESFLYGSGQKQIAAKLGVSRYRVRKALALFKAKGSRQ
jgi:DNA-directed RNA polymerase specialized sigma subunit